MKKKIWIFLFAVFVSTPLLAQWKIAPKAGVVLSTLKRDGNININGGTVGFMGGLMFKRNMGELGWFVQPELQYAYFGDGEQKLSFFKIPLVLGLDFSDDVNVHLAYQPGFLVGGDNDAKENFKHVNHEISLGMDFIAGQKVLLGLRINYGLTNLVENPAEVKNYDVNTFTVDLYIGFIVFNSEN
jgi:hypothetical protein